MDYVRELAVVMRAGDVIFSDGWRVLHWPILPVAILAVVMFVFHVAGAHRVTVGLCGAGLVAQHGALWWTLQGYQARFAGLNAHLLLLLSCLTAVLCYRISWPAHGRSRKLLDAQEAVERALGEERARIARELHDIVGHNLTVISLQARMSWSAHGDTRLTFIDETAQQTMHEIGGMMRTLRAGAPTTDPTRQLPLAVQVRAVVEELRSVGLTVRLTVTGQDVVPPSGICQVVERVVRETLINTMKYARSHPVFVELRIEDEIELRVATRPDSCGSPDASGSPAIPASAPFVSTGFGLQGLAEQVAFHGGVLVRDRTSSEPFVVHVRIPLMWNRTRTASA